MSRPHHSSLPSSMHACIHSFIIPNHSMPSGGKNSELQNLNQLRRQWSNWGSLKRDQPTTYTPKKNMGRCFSSRLQTGFFRWTSYSSTLTSERRDLSKLPTSPRKGFSRGAGWRLSSLNSMSAWHVETPDVPTGILCRTYVQGIVLIPTKKHSEAMGVYSFMQLQSFLIKRYHT